MLIVIFSENKGKSFTEKFKNEANNDQSNDYIPGESIELKFIPTQSELFRYLYPSQCEPYRTNKKNVLYLA